MVSTIVDPKLVFKSALETPSCTNIIACHNHPSEDPKPSREDDHLTEKLKNGAKLLDLNLIDHIIVCSRTYYSYADSERL